MLISVTQIILLYLKGLIIDEVKLIFIYDANIN